MAQIIIEIKDGYETAIAKGFGLSYPDAKEASTEEKLNAIRTYLYSVIEPFYEQAVKQDPEVIAKEAELNALIEQKLQATKEAVKD